MLLPQASSQLMIHCHNIHVGGCLQNSINPKKNFEKRKREEGKRYGKIGYLAHYSFDYPENGRHFIALTCEASPGLVCGSIGPVQNCCILHAHLLRSPVRPFTRNRNLGVILESYEGCDDDMLADRHELNKSRSRVFCSG